MLLGLVLAALSATQLTVAQAPDCNGHFSTHAAHDYSSNACRDQTNPHFYFENQCEGATLGCCKSCGACCTGRFRENSACVCGELPFAFARALCRGEAEQDHNTCKGTCAHNFTNCSESDLNWDYPKQLGEDDKCS